MQAESEYTNAMPVPVDQRQRWMSTLAKASLEELLGVWDALDKKPGYQVIRDPETGLVMVQGRQGGTGSRFNFGEMTVTRCVVRIENGPTGMAYVSGRDSRHAELAAFFDALFQGESLTAAQRSAILEPLERKRIEQRRHAASKTAATRVDFFTLVRGED